MLIDGMDAEMQRLWAERAVRAVNRVFPDIENDFWIDCEHYLPQAQSCAELIDRYGLMFSEAVRLLYRTGIYLRQRARYQEAESLYQRALQHPYTAITLHNLATLYQAQSKYE